MRPARILLPAAALSACTAAASDGARGAPPPVHEGARAEILDGDLAGVVGVRMRGGRRPVDLGADTGCAIAALALARDHGYARHLRTIVAEEGGVWTADAVYTLSPAEPRGAATIDATARVAACAEQEIPTL